MSFQPVIFKAKVASPCQPAILLSLDAEAADCFRLAIFLLVLLHQEHLPVYWYVPIGGGAAARPFCCDVDCCWFWFGILGGGEGRGRGRDKEETKALTQADVDRRIGSPAARMLLAAQCFLHSSGTQRHSTAGTIVATDWRRQGLWTNCRIGGSNCSVGRRGYVGIGVGISIELFFA